MDILITGAAGVIGTALTKKLIETTDHNVITYDPYLPEDYDIRPHVFDLDKVFKHKRVTNTYDYKIVDVLFRLRQWSKIKCVIHLAEMAINDNKLINSEAIETNVVLTKKLMIQCSSNNIRCIIPIWSELNEYIDFAEYHSLLPKTIVWRSEIPTFYNKGNCVITRLLTPRIIDNEIPYSYFESYVSRIVACYHGTTNYLNIFDNEFFNTISGRLVRSWSTTNRVVDKIIEIIPRRIRDDILLEKENLVWITDEMLLKTVLYYLNMPSLQIGYTREKHQNIDNTALSKGKMLTKSSRKLLGFLSEVIPKD